MFVVPLSPCAQVYAMVALRVRASLSAGEATCDFNSHTGCQPTCVVVFEGGLTAVLIRCPPPCTGALWPMPAWVWRDVQRDFGLGLSTSPPPPASPPPPTQPLPSTLASPAWLPQTLCFLLDRQRCRWPCELIARGGSPGCLCVRTFDGLWRSVCAGTGWSPTWWLGA